MCGEGYTIDEELNKRYDNVEELFELLSDPVREPLVSKNDLRFGILELLENGCFCPDCLYGALWRP